MPEDAPFGDLPLAVQDTALRVIQHSRNDARESSRSPHTDSWTWQAIYRDGSVLCEMDEDGYDVHGFAHVDQDQLAAFQLLPLREGLPTPVVVLAPGQRVIFTRRRRVEVNMGDGSEVSRSTMHLLGWQETVEGRNVKSLSYYLDDGRVLQSTDDQLTM